MFRNTYQKGFLTVFSSTGSKPLANWSSYVKNGHIKRKTDCDLTSLVLEIMGRNVATTYICTPCPGYCSLGIKLPFLTLIVKNLKKFFTFEIQILDDKNQLRRFRVSNYQSMTRVKPFLTSMPLCLSPGWNQIQFNLADFVRRAYGTCYVETVRIQIHANVFLRRIFFSDRLYSEEEKPPEYRLYKTIPEPVKKVTISKKIISKVPKLSKQEPVARPGSPMTTDNEEEVEQKEPEIDVKEEENLGDANEPEAKDTEIKSEPEVKPEIVEETEVPDVVEIQAQEAMPEENEIIPELNEMEATPEQIEENI